MPLGEADSDTDRRRIDTTKALAGQAPSSQHTAGPWRDRGFLPRSFLFSLAPLTDVGGLTGVALPAGSCAVSPDYEWHLASRGASFLLLIGYCIDLRAPDRGSDEVAGSLLDCALRRGSDAMLAETDHLLGRFTAIARSGEGWLVFNDAAATRTTFYADDAPVIASHSSLIGRILGRRPRTRMFRHYRFGLPGNASPVPGVRLLPANLALDLERRGLRRFWPRGERVERRADDVYGRVEQLLLRSAEAIAARWPPALSLTAGFDSRTSLAAFRDLPIGALFTYDRGDVDAVDVEVAAEICRRLGLPHRRIEAVPPDEAPEVYGLLSRMPDYTHFESAAATYVRAFHGAGFVHVRSNLAEIASHRGWFQPPPAHFNASRWKAVLSNPEHRREAGREEALSYLEQEMARFLDLAGYDPSLPSRRSLCGYDVWDLLYWEHRMSTWHSRILFGSDFAFDTAILFNSRCLLELMLSVPLRERMNGTLMKRFIASRLPELAGLPVNPRPMRKRFGVRQAYRGAGRLLPRSLVDRVLR